MQMSSLAPSCSQLISHCRFASLTLFRSLCLDFQCGTRGLLGTFEFICMLRPEEIVSVWRLVHVMLELVLLKLCVLRQTS